VSDLRSRRTRPPLDREYPTRREGFPALRVVVGIDRQQEAVLLNDPARGKLFRVERAEFEKEWLKTNNWTLLAVPKHTE